MNQKLFKLFNFCGEKDIEFTYETGKSGKNQITHVINKTKRSVTIKIVDPEDKSLDELIDNKIKELTLIVL